MQRLAHPSPHVWALQGYQNLIVRGLSVQDVLPKVGVLLLFALALHPGHRPLSAGTLKVKGGTAVKLNLDDIPLILRREIEARILAPFVAELSATFGEEAVREVLRRTIQRIAREQGREMAQRLGGNTLGHLAQVVTLWQTGDALEIQIERQDEQAFVFRVTRCEYAEMYRRLGLGDLGATLSCRRDAAFIEGFNPRLRFERGHTLMEGHAFCDFCYRMEADEAA